jgi:membrane associated rhomboid family serine protease
MVFLPISDDDPLERGKGAPITIGLILACCIVFLWQQASPASVDMNFAAVWGVVPDVARGDVPDVDPLYRYAPFVTYMFLHGGWIHIASNMLFLWIFGDNIEDATGPLTFLFLYLMSGIVGALVYVTFAVNSSEPLIGASGAIAGVLGAYLMVRPCATIRVLMAVVVVRVKAVFVILFWFGIQVWHVLAGTQSNVAWWAHIGGALTGAALITALRAPGVKLFECVPGAGRTITGPWSRRG